jgi:hypothetical protein
MGVLIGAMCVFAGTGGLMSWMGVGGWGLGAGEE